jgi:VanZ family protein
MVRTKKRLALCSSLLVVILAFIWGNSALPGQTSGALSGWVGNLLSKVLPFLSTENGLHFIRKAAHFSEFAALGMVLSWLFGMVGQCRLWQYSLPPLCGSVVACIDETIQIFSPGRYSSIVDVLIDCSGVLTGILVFYLLFYLFRHFRRKKAAIS